MSCWWILWLRFNAPIIPYASLETGGMVGTSLRPEAGLRLAPVIIAEVPMLP